METWTKINIDGTIEEFTTRPKKRMDHVKNLQSHIGGFFETIKVGRINMLVHEEGRLMLPANAGVQKYFKISYDIYGPVIFKKNKFFKP